MGQPRTGGGSQHGKAGEGRASDASILNFALNLKYLEAEFYLRSTTGLGLPMELTTGTGERGEVSGGRAVSFQTPTIRKIAAEIAKDAKEHVAFLRSALGSAAVSRPAISLEAASPQQQWLPGSSRRAGLSIPTPTN